MTATSTYQPYRTPDAMCSLNNPIRPRTRTRTSSLLSVSSTVSLGSIFEIAKAQSTSGVSQQPERHEAHGSFIPLRSATPTLRTFISYPASPNFRAPKKRRRVTFDDRVLVSSPEFWEPVEEQAAPQIPYITCTTPTPHLGTASPTSPSSNDLHPILAKLERKSRLCSQVVQCSTCKKPGRDFSRCPRCSDIWCSRPCRLVGGKRHTCSN
ncbi:hypothetical protein M413DRAFT_18267 [Hebeloma cylindrosporum]|uniref:HIT-type domain-containing protein n=1 Tax=Hebeloma cylindrosporum TaxID=76867 RepID=A0A0C2YQ61_HEBCY|nr:hypothetical protein M413DRAFT_18267 [Hebeloma cylindrosporum h7]